VQVICYIPENQEKNNSFFQFLVKSILIIDSDGSTEEKVLKNLINTHPKEWVSAMLLWNVNISKSNYCCYVICNHQRVTLFRSFDRKQKNL